MKVEQDRIVLARHYIGKARDRYDDGLVLKNMDRYESAANRLYYADAFISKVESGEVEV